MNIKAADADQVFVNDSVEPAVANDIIDVTVYVVVHPAGGDGEEMFVVGAGHSRIVGAAKAAKVFASSPQAPRPPRGTGARTFAAFAAPTSGVRRGVQSSASPPAQSRSANASCNRCWR